jgi:hypothetical protein
MRWIHGFALHHDSDECLIWPFCKSSKGYGRIWNAGKEVVVSRYVCELVHGSPPTPEHEAAHSCGNGDEGCVSPSHLSWKTSAGNAADKLSHGTHIRGERHASAKLTENEALAIMALKGADTQRNLAERFGVSRQAISKIHTGHNWAWLQETRHETAPDYRGEPPALRSAIVVGLQAAE